MSAEGGFSAAGFKSKISSDPNLVRCSRSDTRAEAGTCSENDTHVGPSPWADAFGGAVPKSPTSMPAAALDPDVSAGKNQVGPEAVTRRCHA